MSYFSMNKVIPNEGVKMSNQTAKIAISIPRDELKVLESLRHKLSLSRSAVIQQAVKYWLSYQERRGLIDKYERGYLKKPEDPGHVAHMEKISFETLSKEDW